MLWPHENSEQQRLPLTQASTIAEVGEGIQPVSRQLLKLLSRGGTAPSAYNSLVKASLMAVPNLNICDQLY